MPAVTQSLHPCDPLLHSLCFQMDCFPQQKFPEWGQVASHVELPARGKSTELTGVLKLWALRRKQPKAMLKNLRSRGLQTFCVRLFSLDCTIFKPAQRGLCFGNICDSAKASALHAKFQRATGHHKLLTVLPLFMS